MPAKGRVQVAPGQVIQSSQWGNPLWDQSIQRFDTAAQRTSQWAAPNDGAMSWLDDVKALQLARSGVWGSLSRAWQYARPTDGTFPPGINTGLVSGTVTAAPPGLYQLTGRVVVRSLATNQNGATATLTANGATVTSTVADVTASTNIRNAITLSYPFVHGGGDLIVQMALNVGADTTNVYAAGTYVTAFLTI